MYVQARRRQPAQTSKPWPRQRRGGPSLDHLIRPQQQCLRDRQAEGFRGLEVDDQLELGRLLDGKIGGVGTPVGAGPAVCPPARPRWFGDRETTPGAPPPAACPPPLAGPHGPP